jgi:two-component sensor histidine kinase
MQMPEMDGLELVETIRARYPLVPVILMTAHGSEDVAVQALERGAASYVPKVNLARDLADTVARVLTVAHADRRHERLMECLLGSETTFEFESDATLIPPLVDYLQEHVARIGLCDDTGRIRLGVALEEALLNALYHGNLEVTTEQLREASAELLDPNKPNWIEQRRLEPRFRDRKIRVLAKISNDEAVFVIQDEGPGFESAAIPAAGDPSSLRRDVGRGLVLMRTFMDDVRYNDTGNEVTMVKRREGNGSTS